MLWNCLEYFDGIKEKCDQVFFKTCKIVFKERAYNHSTRVCTRPMVKQCDQASKNSCNNQLCIVQVYINDDRWLLANTSHARPIFLLSNSNFLLAKPNSFLANPNLLLANVNSRLANPTFLLANLLQPLPTYDSYGAPPPTYTNQVRLLTIKG